MICGKAYIVVGALPPKPCCLVTAASSSQEVCNSKLAAAVINTACHPTASHVMYEHQHHTGTSKLPWVQEQPEALLQY